MNYRKQFEKETGKDYYKEWDGFGFFEIKYGEWLEKRLKEVEEVLKWYADKENHIEEEFEYGQGCYGDSKVHEDKGQKARDYFKEKE